MYIEQDICRLHTLLPNKCKSLVPNGMDEGFCNASCREEYLAVRKTRVTRKARQPLQCLT